MLALILAVVLGNLGTLHVISTYLGKMGGYEPQPSLAQIRQQELETHRSEIYQDFYREELDNFRDDHNGAEPQTPDEVIQVTQKAQERTDQYIRDTAHHPPLVRLWEYGLRNLRQQLSAILDGGKEAIKGEPLPMAPHRWYWQPTRIIQELPGGAGHNAIAEFPYFTFLYGDLHAHMIAMPVTMLALLWLLAEILGAGYHLRTPWEAGLALGIGSLAVGVLRPTNSWDWITYLILGSLALTYAAWLGAVRTRRTDPPSPVAQQLLGWLRPTRAWRLLFVLLVIPLAVVTRILYYLLQTIRAEEQAGRALQPGEELIDASLSLSSLLLWAVGAVILVVVIYGMVLILLRARMSRAAFAAWIGRVVGFILLTFVAAMPFTRYFATAYNSVSPWEYDTTPLWAYLYIHGVFLFIITSLLIWQTARWLRRMTVRDMTGMAVPVVVIGLGLAGALLISLWVGVRRIPALQVTGPLIIWAGLLFFLPRQSPLVRALNALAVLAMALTIGVEMLVLDGDIGRQNTVFKFYIQAWFFFSVVGGVALAWLLRGSNHWNIVVRGAWQMVLAVLFTIGLLYPILATRARFVDRFNGEATPLTLDGMEYMRYATHGEEGVWFDMESDYRIIRWLQENVEGSPVVMEAHQYPSEYHWGGRISIYTGLPTLLGWNWHQRQQRSLPTMDVLVQTRENNTAAFYELSGSEGIQAAWDMIQEYDIEYIVVGVLERATYGDFVGDPIAGTVVYGHSPGLAKFDQMVDMGLL